MLRIKNKSLFLATAFLSLLTISCLGEIEEVMQNNPEEGGDIVESGPHVIFTAASESTDDTKATLDGFDVVWSAGDEISISDNMGNTAVYTAESEGTSTQFKYKSGKTLSTADGVVYTAWYPKGCADGYIPGVQTHVENGIHDIPMKAVSEGSTDLHFKNLTGIVKVRLQGAYDNICAVVLAADKPVTGAFSKDVQPGNSAVISGSGTAQITIPSGNGRDISTGKDYYFAAAEGTYKELWIGVLNTDGKLAYYTGNEISVRRSVITSLGTVNVVSMGGTEVVNLSQSSPANCYIADAKTDYKFRADRKGCSTSIFMWMSPKSADILWSESTSGGCYSVIRPVILYDGYIWFRKNKPDEIYSPGNAVIAARDASGKILWSWHIWGTESISSSTWDKTGYEMMDRNLGAWSADSENSGAAGLVYQWGRKDPFPLRRGKNFPEAVASDATVGNTNYSIANPTQWIYGTPENCYDWLSSPSTSAWKSGSSKSQYDPCPPGWHLPDGAGHGIKGSTRESTPITLSGFWNKAFGTGVAFYGRSADGSQWWNPEKKGMTVPSAVAGSATWLPATGYIAAESGELVASGYEGSIWTSGSEPSKSSIAATSYCMSFGNGRISPSSMSGRAAGRSVRCIK